MRVRSEKMIDRKIAYYQYKINKKKKSIAKHNNVIYQYAKKYQVDYSVIYGIVLLESINRGSWLIRTLEKIFVYFFTSYAVKRDLSLGLAQVKISTANKFYPDIKAEQLAKNLLNEEFNIRLCSNIIASYYVSSNEDNVLMGLVKYYTTGNSYSKVNDSIIIYYKLLNWLLESN